MVSYPRQNSNFSFEIHFFKFDIQVSVLCITFFYFTHNFFVICMQLFLFYTQLIFHSTSSILYTKFCILYTTFSIQLFLFYIQLFVLATFYFQPQSNKKHTAGSLYQPLTKVPMALPFRCHILCFILRTITVFYKKLTRRL